MLVSVGVADADACRRYSRDADTVLHQIAVNLGRKVRARIFQPFQDLQAPVIGQGAVKIGVGH